MGVISPVLAAQALLGQETQPELRGAVNGLFSAMGAVGILAISLAGGYLFDLWKPYPFLVVAVMNLLLLGAGFRLGEQPGRK
jgi:MFS family permease